MKGTATVEASDWHWTLGELYAMLEAISAADETLINSIVLRTGKGGIILRRTYTPNSDSITIEETREPQP